MKIFLRIIYIKIAIFHFVTAQSQVIEKKFEIDSNQTIIFHFEDKHLVKIMDKRMVGDDIYGYHFCFTKSRLDSIWFDFNPGYTFMVFDNKEGLKELNAYNKRESLLFVAQKNTRNFIPMINRNNPDYVFKGKNCYHFYSTYTRLEPQYHSVEISYDICRDGQIKSILENYEPNKNGLYITVRDNNFISSIETYKNDTLEGVHVVFKKNRKLKFMFICVDGVRYNMMSYNQVLKLNK